MVKYKIVTEGDGRRLLYRKKFFGWEYLGLSYDLSKIQAIMTNYVKVDSRSFVEFYDRDGEKIVNYV